MFVIDALFVGWIIRKWLRKNSLRVAVQPADTAPQTMSLPAGPPWEPATVPSYTAKHTAAYAEETKQIREHYQALAWEYAA